MPTLTLELGSAETLVKLFAYPNEPGSWESLDDTILHWVKQMLARDGFAGKGATASVQVDGSKYSLILNGPDEIKVYADRLPTFLKYGEEALNVIEKEIKNEPRDQPFPEWFKLLYPKMEGGHPVKGSTTVIDRLWDPLNRGTWRFFLPLGMAMVRQKAVNFFHYPPMRLLDQMRDYLDDPVPVRLIELMRANGIDTLEEAWLYSTVMDGTPIAAPDDEGTIYHPEGWKKGEVHLLPIEKFGVYQEKLTELLLNTSSVDAGYTVPIVVYGSPALKSFNTIWKDTKLSREKPASYFSIVKGKQTPVLSSGHPYAFFAQVQTSVGAGEMKPEAWAKGVETMINDLAVIRWQIQMSKNPNVDPLTEWNVCLKYWQDPSRLKTVHALVLHQGSLYYPDPKSLVFEFRLSLKDAEDNELKLAKDMQEAFDKAARKVAKAAAKADKATAKADKVAAKPSATEKTSKPKARRKSV